MANQEGREQSRSPINSRETKMSPAVPSQAKRPWNKGMLVGRKAPFKLKDVWAIRIRLQIQNRTRELALLDVGIDSKLRACDLVGLRVRDVCQGDRVSARAITWAHANMRASSITGHSGLGAHCSVASGTWNWFKAPAITCRATLRRCARAGRLTV